MLTRSNVFEVSRQGYALYRGDKWTVSRSLRRFLTEVAASSNSLFLSFAFDEGYSKEQLDAIAQYAQEREEHARQYLAEGGVTFRGVHRDNDFASVFSEFALSWNPATASLKELQLMVKAVVVLSDCMHEFVAFPNENALRNCPMYKIRGAACNIADDENLWCVSGQDKRDGGSGVLEWCYSQDDALERFDLMSRFPERFIGLTAQPFLAAFGRLQVAA